MELSPWLILQSRKPLHPGTESLQLQGNTRPIYLKKREKETLNIPIPSGQALAQLKSLLLLLSAICLHKIWFPIRESLPISFLAFSKRAEQQKQQSTPLLAYSMCGFLGALNMLGFLGKSSVPSEWHGQL